MEQQAERLISLGKELKTKATQKSEMKDTPSLGLLGEDQTVQDGRRRRTRKPQKAPPAKAWVPKSSHPDIRAKMGLTDETVGFHKLECAVRKASGNCTLYASMISCNFVLIFRFLVRSF